MLENIQDIYKTAKTYPELVEKLIALGIRSYTVDVATGTILYRLDDGEHVMHHGDGHRTIAGGYSEQATIQAIRNNQQGKTDYPGFMQEIAGAGINFYEATLNGERKRVTYIGKGGHYEENIPL